MKCIFFNDYGISRFDGIFWLLITEPEFPPAFLASGIQHLFSHIILLVQVEACTLVLVRIFRAIYSDSSGKDHMPAI